MQAHYQYTITTTGSSAVIFELHKAILRTFPGIFEGGITFDSAASMTECVGHYKSVESDSQVWQNGEIPNFGEKVRQVVDKFQYKYKEITVKAAATPTPYNFKREWDFENGEISTREDRIVTAETLDRYTVMQMLYAMSGDDAFKEMRHELPIHFRQDRMDAFLKRIYATVRPESSGAAAADTSSET